MILSFNNRGQIGKLISSVPLMILIFIIIGIFIFLAASLGARYQNSDFRSATVAPYLNVFEDDDLMYMTVNVQVAGQPQNMYFYEMLYKNINGEVSDTQVDSAMKSMLSEERPLVFVAKRTTDSSTTNANLAMNNYFRDSVDGKIGTKGGLYYYRSDSHIEYSAQEGGNLIIKQQLSKIRTISFLVKDKEGKETRYYIDYYLGGVVPYSG